MKDHEAPHTWTQPAVHPHNSVIISDKNCAVAKNPHDLHDKNYCTIFFFTVWFVHNVYMRKMSAFFVMEILSSCGNYLLCSLYMYQYVYIKNTCLGGQSRSRLQQLVSWCGGEAFDGCLIFDECHKAKNFNPGKEQRSTKVALAVSMVQKMLPCARVVYCSATGVSDVKNMV